MLVTGRGMLREQQDSGFPILTPVLPYLIFRVISNFCPIRNGFAGAHTAGYDCKIKEFKLL